MPSSMICGGVIIGNYNQDEVPVKTFTKNDPRWSWSLENFYGDFELLSVARMIVGLQQKVVIRQVKDRLEFTVTDEYYRKYSVDVSRYDVEDLLKLEPQLLDVSKRWHMLYFLTCCLCFRRAKGNNPNKKTLVLIPPRKRVSSVINLLSKTASRKKEPLMPLHERVIVGSEEEVPFLLRGQEADFDDGDKRQLWGLDRLEGEYTLCKLTRKVQGSTEELHMVITVMQITEKRKKRKTSKPVIVFTLHDDDYRCHEVAIPQDMIYDVMKELNPNLLEPGISKDRRHENRWLLLHTLADLIRLRSRADDPDIKEAVLFSKGDIWHGIKQVNEITKNRDTNQLMLPSINFKVSDKDDVPPHHNDKCVYHHKHIIRGEGVCWVTMQLIIEEESENDSTSVKIFVTDQIGMKYELHLSKFEFFGCLSACAHEYETKEKNHLLSFAEAPSQNWEYAKHAFDEAKQKLHLAEESIKDHQLEMKRAIQDVEEAKSNSVDIAKAFDIATATSMAYNAELKNINRQIADYNDSKDQLERTGMSGKTLHKEIVQSLEALTARVENLTSALLKHEEVRKPAEAAMAIASEKIHQCEVNATQIRGERKQLREAVEAAQLEVQVAAKNGSDERIAQAQQDAGDLLHYRRQKMYAQLSTALIIERNRDSIPALKLQPLVDISDSGNLNVSRLKKAKHDEMIGVEEITLNRQKLAVNLIDQSTKWGVVKDAVAKRDTAVTMTKSELKRHICGTKNVEQRSKLLISLGFKQYNDGDYNLAASTFQRAIDENKSVATGRVWHALGRSHYVEWKKEQTNSRLQATFTAYKYASKALMNIANPSFWLEMARLYLQFCAFEASAQTLSIMIKQFPSFSKINEVVFLSASIMQHLGMYSQAAVYFSYILSNPPKDYKPLHICFLIARNKELKIYPTRHKVQDTNDNPKSMKSKPWQDDGLTSIWKPTFSKIKANKYNGNTNSWKGWRKSAHGFSRFAEDFSKGGDNIIALDCRSIAAALSPNDPHVLYEFALSLHTMQEYEKSIKYLEKCVQLARDQSDKPINPDYLSTLQSWRDKRWSLKFDIDKTKLTKPNIDYKFPVDEEEESEWLREEAAIKIQCVARGSMQRNNMDSDLKKILSKKKRRTIARLQEMYTSNEGKIDAVLKKHDDMQAHVKRERRKMNKQREKAAIEIQCSFRRHAARQVKLDLESKKITTRELQHKWENENAIKIQKLSRGRQSRRKYRKMSKHDAAKSMQRIMRGAISRKQCRIIRRDLNLQEDPKEKEAREWASAIILYPGLTSKVSKQADLVEYYRNGYIPSRSKFKQHWTKLLNRCINEKGNGAEAKRRLRKDVHIVTSKVPGSSAAEALCALAEAGQGYNTDLIHSAIDHLLQPVFQQEVQQVCRVLEISKYLSEIGILGETQNIYSILKDTKYTPRGGMASRQRNPRINTKYNKFVSPAAHDAGMRPGEGLPIIRKQRTAIAKRRKKTKNSQRTPSPSKAFDNFMLSLDVAGKTAKDQAIVSGLGSLLPVLLDNNTSTNHQNSKSSMRNDKNNNRLSTKSFTSPKNQRDQMTGKPKFDVGQKRKTSYTVDGSIHRIGNRFSADQLEMNDFESAIS